MTTTEPSRREMILDAAAALFRTHGFHGAGIDEIGAAAGISGPGVYRHFPNKHALLVAMSERVVDRLVNHNERVIEEESDPVVALARLVKTHASFAFGSAELIGVYVQEHRNLPEPDRKRISRKQGQYVDGWVRLLRQISPTAPDAQLKAVVLAVSGMINSVTMSKNPEDASREVVEQMAMAALLAGARAASSQ